MPADIPDLSHVRQPSAPAACWQCECGTLVLGELGPDALCPARVAAWGVEQRAAGAAEARAHIVAWLRAKAEAAFAVRERQTVADYGHYGAAYTWAADGIERDKDRTP